MPRKKSTLTRQNPFPILRLPLEIRNRIWRYTLVKDGDVMIRPRRHQELFKDWVQSRLRSGKKMRWHQEDDERRNRSTPLALSSRQLHPEATWIYGSGNTFNFEKGSYPLILEDFAAALGSYNASSITAVRFDAVGPSYIQRLSVLPSLKQLTINGPLRCLVYDRMYYNMDWLPELSTYARNHPSVVVRTQGWLASTRTGSFLGKDGMIATKVMENGLRNTNFKRHSQNQTSACSGVLPSAPVRS